MTLKELLDILDEASDVVIYCDRKEYTGCLEDMDFREDIKPLYEKKVSRIMPVKTMWHKEKYFDGNPYLEVEIW